jgi:hypothetical protein
MRAARGVLLGILALAPGCYLAHERVDPVDAGTDAPSFVDACGMSLRDANLDDAWEPDVSATCRVTCDPPTVLGTLVRTPAGSYESFLGNVVVSDGALYGLVMASRSSNEPPLTRDGVSADIGRQPYVFRFDLGTGEARWLEPVQHTGSGELDAGVIRVVDREVRLTMLQDVPEPGTNVFHVQVATAAWSLAGALLREDPHVFRDDTALLQPPMFHNQASIGAVIATQRGVLALYTQSTRVQGYVLDDGAPPRPVTVATLADDMWLAPIDAIQLDATHLAVAGGGWPFGHGGGGDLRQAFFALTTLDGPAVAAQPVIGVIQNTPPVLAREASGLALIRYAGSSQTAPDNTIVISHRDPSGTVLREARIPRPDATRPSLMSAFESPDGTGLVWFEHVESFSGDLRLLWPGMDQGCDTLSVAPFVRVPPFPGGLAAAVDGGSVYVISMQEAQCAEGFYPVLTLYRVDRCAVGR